MKKMLTALVLTLPVLAVPGQASASFKIEFSGGAGINIYCPGQAGPWYKYWPYEAHFMTPAPTGYPFYPQPMALGVPPYGLSALSPQYGGNVPWGPVPHAPVGYAPPQPASCPSH